MTDATGQAIRETIEQRVSHFIADQEPGERVTLEDLEALAAELLAELTPEQRRYLLLEALGDSSLLAAAAANTSGHGSGSVRPHTSGGTS